MKLADIKHLERLSVRFWSKVDKSGECWVWTGARLPTGYGTVGIVSDLWGGCRPIGAHRIAYLLAHGEIPDGQFVLHGCDNPPCVRPDHLYTGTAADNLADAIGRGRFHGVSLPGARNPNARLSPEQAAEIRRRRWNGEKSVALAREFGVSPRLVYLISRKKLWSTLPDGGVQVNLQPKNALKTHCIRGHPFTPDNTQIRPNGARRCRACMRMRSAARYRERKSQARAAEEVA